LDKKSLIRRIRRRNVLNKLSKYRKSTKNLKDIAGSIENPAKSRVSRTLIAV
jgi:hypothetical protein